MDQDDKKRPVHKQFWGYGRIIGFWCNRRFSSCDQKHSFGWKNVTCKYCLREKKKLTPLVRKRINQAVKVLNG